MSNSLQPHGLYSPWNSLGQNTGVGSLSLLQGIFPIQGSNPGLPLYRQILYQLSYQGRHPPSPRPPKLLKTSEFQGRSDLIYLISHWCGSWNKDLSASRRDNFLLVCLFQWRAKSKKGPSCLNPVIQESKREERKTWPCCLLRAVIVNTLTLCNWEERSNNCQTLTNQTSYSSSQGREWVQDKRGWSMPLRRRKVAEMPDSVAVWYVTGWGRGYKDPLKQTPRLTLWRCYHNMKYAEGQKEARIPKDAGATLSIRLH